MNLRSLNQNFESLKKLLNTIKFEFKVIWFTEKWCTDDPRNKTFFNLENYTSINLVRKDGRGVGICVFIQNSLTFKLNSDLATNSNDIGSRAIEIINKKAKVQNNQYKTYLENFFNKMKNSNRAIYIHSKRHKS